MREAFVEHEESKSYNPYTAKRDWCGASAQRQGAAFVLAVAVSSALVAMTITLSATACPNCAVGKQARSAVWSDDFGFHLALAAIPFIVIGALCLCAEWIGRARATRRPGKPATKGTHEYCP
jgi:hypothetical protein